MILTPATPRQLSTGVAIVRIAVAVVMIMHGYQKFFIYGLDGVAGMFTQNGIPMANVAAPLVATLELGGGIALLLGLLTRLVALAFMIDMIGAVIFVHAKGGFFVPAGIELVMLLASCALALVIAGGGALSVDEAIGRRRFRRSDDVIIRSTP